MAVSATQITIPSNGSTVTVLQNAYANASQVSLRNTGTVTVLLGGSDGNLVFPLAANEYLGLVVTGDDIVQAKVQSAGTAGQITLLTS